MARSPTFVHHSAASNEAQAILRRESVTEYLSAPRFDLWGTWRAGSAVAFIFGPLHATNDPSEKDALLHVPGAGLSLLESMGMASKTDRFTRSDGTNLPRNLSAHIFHATMKCSPAVRWYLPEKNPAR